MFGIRKLTPLAALAVVLACATPSPAETIIDQWSGVTPPPPPELKPIVVDSKTTALLMLDFLQQNCASNPRCVATLPNAQKLLNAARGANAAVVYSEYPGGGDIVPDVARKDTEPLVTAILDKFIMTSKDGNKDTGLDKILKDKGINTVIVVGSAANGAVLYTATSAFFRGYQTIVAVDGVSGRSPYVEQATVYNFVSVPVMGGKVVLTRTDMIKF